MAAGARDGTINAARQTRGQRVQGS